MVTGCADMWHLFECGVYSTRCRHNRGVYSRGCCIFDGGEEI